MGLFVFLLVFLSVFFENFSCFFDDDKKDDEEEEGINPEASGKSNRRQTSEFLQLVKKIRSQIFSRPVSVDSLWTS